MAMANAVRTNAINHCEPLYRLTPADRTGCVPHTRTSTRWNHDDSHHRRRFPILLAAIAALLVFIAVDAASSSVQAQTPSADASLSSLSLSDSLGDDIELSPEFSAATTSYTTDDAELASTVTSTTVTAETTDENATAVIMINGVEDADGAVDLVAGYTSSPWWSLRRTERRRRPIPSPFFGQRPMTMTIPRTTP